MAGSTPRVTVIIPSYNHAQYISEAIESVLNQTYTDIELIVVDDGSQDDSHAVISKYNDHPNVRTILNAKNHGQSAAVNQGLSVANGEYVGLLPSDDWYLPEKISLQITKFKTCGDDVGVIYAGGLRYFEDTGETIQVNLPVHTGNIARKLVELGNFIYPVTPLYRREVLDKIRPSERFKAEGEAIHMRIALHYRYEYVDKALAVMRDHSYNIGKDAEVLYNEIQSHLEWFFSLPELPYEIYALKNQTLFRNSSTKGMQLIADRRNFKMGRRCLTQAFKLSPRSLINPKYAGAYLISLLPRSIANAVLDRLKSG